MNSVQKSLDGQTEVALSKRREERNSEVHSQHDKLMKRSNVSRKAPSVKGSGKSRRSRD